jgi:alpha-D-xyloside xylohydrolase
MQSPKKIRIISTAVLVALSFSCSSKLEKNLSITLKNNYPLITLKSTFNKNIILSPIDSTTGSIGYMAGSLVYWVTGMPEITKPTEAQTILEWSVGDSIRIALSIELDNEDINFKLSNLKYKQSPIQPYRWFVNIQSTENEFFTGVFERVVDGSQKKSWADTISTALDLRGQNIDVKLKPTVSAYAPFYISSENYGLFVKGTWPGNIDFCKKNKDRVILTFEGPELDWKIYTAKNPLDIVRKHALETGPSVIPPNWAFGPWRWRDQHFNKNFYYDKTQKKAPYNTDVVEDVLMMEALDIPSTAFWVDRPWCPGPEGFDDYIFDTVEFPQPEAMIKWLNRKNKVFMLWIAPFVMGDMAKFAHEHNYDLISKVWDAPNQALIDFTNPEGSKWWGENGPGKLAKMGIKGFKLDRADGERHVDSLYLKTFTGVSYCENYNDYPHQFVKATYNAVQPILGNDFILFPRAQYTGSSRYGAMWAGDTDGKPEGLRSAIIGMQRCAIMGYPVWGSDIGGYWGGFSRESTMRWIAFGCFSPIMETGPTNNMGFWSSPEEPFYDIELIATWRLYSKVRMKLKDYLCQQAKKAHADGTPIAMPLFLKYPDQKEAWKDWQTYLLGPDILVSAIWKNEAVVHKLYLPEGEIWVDAWNPGQEHEGGQYIEIDAPLYKIPLFIRKGSKINLGDLKELYSESIKIASVKPDLSELEKKEGWK